MDWGGWQSIITQKTDVQYCSSLITVLYRYQYSLRPIDELETEFTHNRIVQS
jgi:hypothetical protein